MLVGLMGAGKIRRSARAAPSELGRPFVDTDEVVVATSGPIVAEIFATDGESAFRACERAGGRRRVCVARSARDRVRRRRRARPGEPASDCVRRGLVVWLRAAPHELWRRVSARRGRASAARAGVAPIDALERLTTLRAPAYEGAADVTVDTDGATDGRSPTSVIEELRDAPRDRARRARRTTSIVGPDALDGLDGRSWPYRRSSS